MQMQSVNLANEAAEGVCANSCLPNALSKVLLAGVEKAVSYDEAKAVMQLGQFLWQ